MFKISAEFATSAPHEILRDRDINGRGELCHSMSPGLQLFAVTLLVSVLICVVFIKLLDLDGDQNTQTAEVL